MVTTSTRIRTIAHQDVPYGVSPQFLLPLTNPSCFACVTMAISVSNCHPMILWRWNLREGSVPQSWSFTENREIAAMVLSLDGRHLYGSIMKSRAPGELAIWSAQEDCSQLSERVLQGDNLIDQMAGGAPSELLAVAFPLNDQHARRWVSVDLATGTRRVLLFPEKPVAPPMDAWSVGAVSPDGSSLAVVERHSRGSGLTNVLRWRELKAAREASLPLETSEDIVSIVWSRRADRLMLVTRQCSAAIVHGGGVAVRWVKVPCNKPTPYGIYDLHEQEPWGLFSGDDDDGSVILFDIEEQRVRRTWLPYREHATGKRYAPSGSFLPGGRLVLITGRHDVGPSLALYDMDQDNPIQVLKHGAAGWALSNDGTLALADSECVNFFRIEGLNPGMRGWSSARGVSWRK